MRGAYRIITTDQELVGLRGKRSNYYFIEGSVFDFPELASGNQNNLTSFLNLCRTVEIHIQLRVENDI